MTHRPENRWLTVPEILVHSSNIGAARLAVDVGAERQRTFLNALGMFERMPVESSERGWPIVPRRWSKHTTMTVGFGHGLAVTPLHLIASYAALANGGIAVTPTVLKREPGAHPVKRRVISTETSAIMRMLLYAVVAEGTGKKAAVPGYLVGGKTGTAEKAIGGQYKRDRMITNFVGVFPIDRPRYAVLTLMDEPKGTEADVRLRYGRLDRGTRGRHGHRAHRTVPRSPVRSRTRQGRRRAVDRLGERR